MTCIDVFILLVRMSFVMTAMIKKKQQINTQNSLEFKVQILRDICYCSYLEGTKFRGY